MRLHDESNTSFQCIIHQCLEPYHAQACLLFYLLVQCRTDVHLQLISHDSLGNAYQIHFFKVSALRVVTCERIFKEGAEFISNNIWINTTIDLSAFGFTVKF